MKYDVTRSCGHVERVKVYTRESDAHKVVHAKRVLLHEHYKLCRQCSAAKLQKQEAKHENKNSISK